MYNIWGYTVGYTRGIPASYVCTCTFRKGTVYSFKEVFL